MPSTRIAKGECELGKLTEEAFAVIGLFMVKLVSEDGVCIFRESLGRFGCPEEEEAGGSGCLWGVIFVG